MIIREETIENYHRNPALSKSKLLTYAKHGPAHYHRQYIAGTMPKYDKPSFAIGRAFDDLLCNGKPSWIVKPEGIDMRTKAGKEWAAEHEGSDILSADDDRMIYEMRDAMNANPHSAMWSMCETQVSIRRDLPSGVALQSRPDGLDLVGHRLVDLKTCRDLNRFHRDCIDYGYHMQIAMGQWLLAQEGYHVDAYLIVVESKLAPRCKVFKIPELALSAGWSKCEKLTGEIASRYKSGDWTETQMEIEEIQLDSWTERILTEETAS